MYHLKFCMCTLFLCVSLLGFTLGGPFLWSGCIFVTLLGLIGDSLFPLDTRDYEGGKNQVFLEALLFSSLPLVMGTSLLFAWHIGTGDPFKIGYALSQILPWDPRVGKGTTDPVHLLGGFLTMGFVYGVGATNVAHELVHRIRHKPSIFVGRMLLGFTFDTAFSIEHVFGHHRNVATGLDPASARRGEGAWKFFLRSTIYQQINAWNLEKRRLEKKKTGPWTAQNLWIRGQGISFTYLMVYLIIAGPPGTLLFLVTAIYGKAYLEFVNYIEHYGLLRVEGSSIELRHSWNSNHALSSYLLYNLPRHAHHHILSMAPFWKVKSCEKAPSMPYGYLVMIILAGFPRLFEKMMRPHLRHWDLNFASKDEQGLAMQANRAAGWTNDYLSHLKV